MNDMAASNPAGILALMEVSPTRAYEQIKETRKRKQHYIQSLTQWTGHFLILRANTQRKIIDINYIRKISS